MHNIYNKIVIIMVIISILLLLFLLDKEEYVFLSMLLTTMDGQVNTDYFTPRDMKGTVNGVLDRIEERQAVILIEELNEQWDVPLKQLPKESELHMWFTIQYEKDEYKLITINQDKTKVEKENVANIMKKLRRAK